uniref:G_PROTEIN_RECEP_F1_2 domain-containing protein n=1 Tax=Globodera pallida TaxID=36090 RepID=A0A183C0E5_GLOPA
MPPLAKRTFHFPCGCQIRSISFKMMKPGSSSEDLSGNLTLVEMALPLRGFRQYVALTYFACNLLGLFANSWVLFVVGPLLWMPNVRVPKSILFHILALCVSDLATMCAMVLLNLEIFCGTWRLGSMSCTAYLLFDSMNKFSAPIIVLLISRTCYSTVCLDKRRQQSAASLKMAFVQVLVSLCLVLVLLWPLFAYSEVSSMPIRVDNTTRRVNWLSLLEDVICAVQLLFIRKCAFVPPPSVESVFNIVVCIVSYAIPFAGFLYWYASVPFFLWRKKEHLMASQQSSSGTAARGQQSSTAVIRRVVLTVLVLALVYLVCWTPYWLGIFARRLLNLRMSPKQSVITMYFVHLMPYVSCAASPAIFTLLNRPIRSAHSHWKRSMQRRIQQSRLARRLRDVLGSYECHQIGGVRKGSHPVRHHAQKQDVPRRSTMSAGERGEWNKEAALIVDSRAISEVPVPPVRDESKADTGFEDEGTSWHEEEDVIL